MHTSTRTILAVVMTASLAGLAAPAEAHGRQDDGSPGRIAFGRVDPTLDDTVIHVVNPDGSNLRRLIPGPHECPHWSPDGTQIATCGDPTNSATRIIDAATGTSRLLAMPDATLFTACFVWSPDAARLACESFSDTDPGRNGIYSIRTSDGRGLRRITTNPGGDDNPGSYSPDGRQLVFSRSSANGDPLGLFVVRIDGTGLRRLTPPGALVSSTGDWSARANEIVFARQDSPDVHTSMWIIRADGRGLREIRVRGLRCGGSVLDPAAAGCGQPTWSPNGQEVAFAVHVGNSTEHDIYTARTNGRQATQVTSGAVDEGPDWGRSPAGR